MRNISTTIVSLFLCLSLLGFVNAQTIVLSPKGIVVNPLPEFEVEVFLDKDPSGEASPSYQLGEPVRIGVHASEASYVYLYDVKPDGTITQILPNRFDAFGANNFLAAGETKYFPPQGARYSFTIDGPGGLSKVIAVASKQQLDTTQLARFDGEVGFASSSIGELGFGAALSIVVEPVPQAEWVTDTALYLVGSAQQIPVYGTIRIVSQPSGAQAYVDGQFVGYTPLDFGIESGVHSVVTELEGFSSYQTSVEVNGNQTVNINAVLLAETRMGTVRFETQPHGAEVFLNGDYIGTTPLEVSVAVGEHRAQFKRNGFRKSDVELMVGSGTYQTVVVDLRPKGRGHDDDD
ncbi:MAG: PEGA domain-containing protein [Trueperaceae bacterium]|nr:MAG: PEGA domain-containing protein [Trueperaceae bacterium]